MTDWRVLHFFSRVQPRKATVLRQILTNKRTGSTLYWGLRYHYLNYLNCEPHLNIQDFERTINILLKQGFLLSKKQGLLLTDQGKALCDDQKNEYSFSLRPDLNQKYDYHLWQSILMLMVQVASEASYHNSNYYVASSNLRGQYFIKSWIKVYGIDKLVDEVPKALTNFLDHIDDSKANLFASKLIGHTKNGLSDQQLASLLKIDPLEIQITWKDLVLQFADYLSQQNFNINQLARVTMLPGILTSTIQNTSTLFNQGKDVFEIMKLRHLRQSTIEEHLQILAIFQPSFPFERILSDQDIKIFEKVYGELPVDQWRFCQLEHNGYTLSFLKFRLYAVMKTHGENNE